MTKQERNWLIWGTIGTAFLMLTFVFLMSDYSPLYHPATSNTQALINSLQSHASDASASNLLIFDTNDGDHESPNPSEQVETAPELAAMTDNNQLKATNVDWDTVDTDTIDFDNLDLAGSDLFTGDQIMQLLENSENQQ